MSLQDLIILNEKCEELEKEVGSLKWENEGLADRLRIRDMDNERLCKISIAHFVGLKK